MRLTAIILAAGSSKRMGQPKMVLPWGHTTVIGTVIEILKVSGIEDILVVTGGAREQVEEAISQYPVRTIHNAKFARREMLNSIQFGLRALYTPFSLPRGPGGRDAILTFPRGRAAAYHGQSDAALIVLGDQPQMEAQTIRAILDCYEKTGARLIVPSYQMRRGHPWLMARPLWWNVTGMRPTLTLRDFLRAHSREIEYVNVDTPSIFADLDTPEDYLKSRP